MSSCCAYAVRSDGAGFVSGIRPDLFVGDLGLQTKLKASKSSKASLRTHMQLLHLPAFRQLGLQFAHLCPQPRRGSKSACGAATVSVTLRRA